ncbi:unnamed protein product [Caenorhabditis sp. 36 PRJEB53466]|nr:unnamed protein product [Caenorhabditis sp. 36 PRJEB53466]
MRSLLVLLPAVLAVALAQEHFLDVRALVKDTIDAIKEVPAMMQNQNQTTSSTSSEPEVSTAEPTKVVKARSDVYDTLLKLPADIMSQLARDAGFVDEKTAQKEVVEGKKQEETERVEKKIDDEESYSFKTVEDIKAEEQRRLASQQPTVATRQSLEDNDDIFSISKLISATGNAIREAQAAQKAQAAQQPQQEPMITLPPLVPLPPAPLQMPALQLPAAIAQPATEIMYRPVTKDGKTVFEQVVVLKDANGSMTVLPNTVLPAFPDTTKKVEIKQVKKVTEAAEFSAPTFPPVVNLFDQLTSTTEASTTTTTQEPEVTTTTTTEEPVKPKRKSLPRRKIQYLEKKMSDPIEIQAQEEQEPVNVLQKEAEKDGDKVEEKPEEKVEETTEPPKKMRKLMRKVHKTAAKKEIRKFPDLYDEQWKTQVAPSVSPPSEDFAEQFDGVDEVQEQRKELEQKPQNDTPMNDPMEQRSSKVQMVTKEQEEDILNKEVHKRVLQRIRLSKLKSAEKASTTTTAAPEKEEKPEESEDAEEDEEDESSADDVIEVEELDEEEEEVNTTTTTTTTTTTEAPVTRAERIKKTKKRAFVTKHQCLNLRSFARQFLFDTVEEFAKEHCYFIENYYPALTCARSNSYVAKCQKWLKEGE